MYLGERRDAGDQDAGLICYRFCLRDAVLDWSQLILSEAAVCGDGTVRSSRSHQLGLIVTVEGVSPATISREKATMWPLRAVLFA